MKISNDNAHPRAKVLLIDDNQDLAEVTAMLLGLVGFESHVCYSGQEGVRLAKATRPDVILLDIDMPFMDNFQVCRQIRSHAWGRQIGIIAYTGRDSAATWKQDAAQGFDGHLSKPADIEVLSRAILSTVALKSF